MTGPPKHLKDPLKVTIRQKKLLAPGPTGPPRRTPVVNSNEIIMVMNRPVAVRNHFHRASRTAAVPGRMTALREAMALSHQAKEKAIRTGQILTTAQKELLIPMAKRKALNQEAHPIQEDQLRMTGLKEAMAASLQEKRKNINQETPRTRAGQLHQMIAQNAVMMASLPEKNGNISQEVRHILAGQPHQMIAQNVIMEASQPERNGNINQEIRQIRDARIRKTVQNAVLMANRPAKEDRQAIKAASAAAIENLHREGPVAVVSKNATVILKASLSVIRKTHPIIINR
jgi:hypothetical protein